ncbi:MAG: Protein of unknown function superfamily [Bacilli bacterium]|nr:Protein of unknown function superfamily [Bacilli bacterium]
MNGFYTAITMHFRVFFHYRKAFLISMVIHPITLMINIVLFKALYAYNGSNSLQGYPLSEMVWYFAGSVFVSIFTWNFTESRLSERILDGSLSGDLIRPMSIFRVELAHAMGLRALGVLIEFIPDIIIFSIIFFPQFMTIASLLKFVFTAILAFFLYFLMAFLIGMTAFVTKNNRSLTQIKVLLIGMLGGAYIPLEFMPNWLNRLVDILPFKYVFYFPIQMLLNREKVQGLDGFLRIVGIQLLWIFAFYLLCKLLWKVMIKKYCAVGG